MRRVLHTAAALGLAAFIGLTVPAQSVRAAEPLNATLKYGIVVDHPNITLGDVLDNTGEAAGLVIARAPTPGDTLALDPRAVMIIAARQNVRWMPPANIYRINVERASRIVPASMLQEEIALSLAALAPERELEISLSTRNMLHVATDQDPTVEVESIDYDSRTGRFTAIVSAPAGDPTSPRTRISGRAWAMIDVPVLSRSVRPGEEITDSDIGWIRMREEQVRRQNVQDPGELIGMSPKRMIAPNRAVRLSDLQAPVMVGKNDTVTMIFRSGGLTLTATGRALEAGGRNEVIRVMNDRSKMTVDARIVAPGRVDVGAGTPRVSALN
ncbi:MAG: flagellar basal body P-ring formation chaperone FlgA [Pseudomonadota bacterium]|nr:flagellar basal body P-ring formation chaperone FlgA [Pseudomonadota bacterium]